MKTIDATRARRLIWGASWFIVLALAIMSERVPSLRADFVDSKISANPETNAPTAAPTVWSALPNGGLNGNVWTMAISGTDVYVGGDFTQTADGAVTNLNHIALLRGGAWYPLANLGLNLSVRTIAISGTKIFVGGDFTQTGDGTIQLGHIAQYSGGAWSALQNGGLNDRVNTIAISGTQFYVGGSFSQSFDNTIPNLNLIASYNGGTWSALAHNGLSGSSVYALAITGTTVYVGGAFSQSGDGAITNTISIASYNGSTWSALANNGLDLAVRAIAVNGSDLYVGGSFRHPANSSILSLERIALYSAGVWSPLTNGGLDSEVDALAMIGNDLYVGGNFSASSDLNVSGLNHFALYNSGWITPSNGGVDNNVQALAISGTVSAYNVFVGGQFTKSNDNSLTSLNHIAKLQYTISSNANLNNLILSNGTLTPPFATGTFNYSATVPYTLTNLTVTPFASDWNSSIKINGAVVASNNPSAPIVLSTGANPITTVVTAQDGVTTKTYTVTVTRPPSGNADLSNLILSNGTLSPAFSSSITAYTTTVASVIASITITPTTADTGATVKVNGVAAVSGAGSTVSLNPGANPITVTVTAQDSTSKNYFVTVTRSTLNGNADLSNLGLSNGSLNPGFASGVMAYTASVANNITSITLTPTLSDLTASVVVNNVSVASGVASVPISLTLGANTITTTVTAQDGVTIKNYVVTVTRAASNNADLSNLVFDSGPLTPPFDPATTVYTVTVTNAVAFVTVTPTLSDTNAISITVNGAPVTSGTSSGQIALNYGANLITTIVWAQDGTTTKSYAVTITRVKSSDAKLSSLTLNNGILSPTFDPFTTAYSTTVGSTITSVTATPIVADSTATVTVNSVLVTSGNASAPIALSVGDNLITTTVTAQDGVTIINYVVTVTRLASSETKLSNLVLSSGTLAPPFSSSSTTYAATVANNVVTITVTPTALDNTATIQVNGITVLSGHASTAINLSLGDNLITTTVTAQDGVTIRNYIVTVTRSTLSNNADLSSLILSKGTITPTLSSGNTIYSATVQMTVTSIIITPTVAFAGATVKVNGTSVTSGTGSSAIPLLPGTNVVTLAVTAQDGVTIKTYSLRVGRGLFGNRLYLPLIKR